MTEHTPGPWTFEMRETPERTVHYVIRTESDSLPEHPWSARFICWMTGLLGDAIPRRRIPEDFRRDERIEADAALIAAAPDLLEAAEALADGPHVLQVRVNGWGMQHPLRCRPALTECVIHIAASEMDGPIAEPGEYEVILHEPDAISEPYGAPPLDIIGPAGPDVAPLLLTAIAKARGVSATEDTE